jgi:hypothetical protein
MCSITLDAAPGHAGDGMLDSLWKVIHQDTKYNNKILISNLCSEFNI